MTDADQKWDSMIDYDMIYEDDVFYNAEDLYEILKSRDVYDKITPEFADLLMESLEAQQRVDELWAEEAIEQAEIEEAVTEVEDEQAFLQDLAAPLFAPGRQRYGRLGLVARRDYSSEEYAMIDQNNIERLAGGGVAWEDLALEIGRSAGSVRKIASRRRVLVRGI